MKGTLGLKKGSVPFKNDLETTLIMYVHTYTATTNQTKVKNWFTLNGNLSYRKLACLSDFLVKLSTQTTVEHDS